MLRHLFRLIWNRKRTNVLLLSEIFFSFIVLFVVGAVLITGAHDYLLAPGFRHEQVWRLNVAAGQGEKMPRPVLDDVLRQVRALPGVEELALCSPNTPFRFINMNTDIQTQKGDAKADLVEQHDADDHYGPALGITLREGRWFKPSDDASSRRPVVITQDVREKLFGTDKPALGQVLRMKMPAGPVPKDEFVVVGVADNVRWSSDFSDYTPTMWKRLVPFDTTHWETAAVLVRVSPGQGAALQQKIVRTIAGVTRKWSTEVYPLSSDRHDKLKVVVAPLAALAVVGLFLIVNVALGLFGVLWYNISQRRAEIGLRRALGATSTSIGWQFLGEMLVLTLMGVSIGLLLAAQFPLLGAFDVAAEVYVLAMLLASGIIFVLTAVCAWHPSRLAAAIHPAAALREE